MSEKVFFENSRGNRLCGVLSRPTGATTCLVLVHGMNSSKDSKTYPRMEEELVQLGVASFRIDLYAHGESEGVWENVCVSEGIDDINKALDYVKSLGFSRIALLGCSFGGACALQVASSRNDLEFLLLKAPVTDYKRRFIDRLGSETIAEWKREGRLPYRPGKERLYSFYEDCLHYDGFAAASKISLPTLIVHGDKDLSVALAYSERAASLFEQGELRVLEGAGHKIEGERFEDMITAFLEFVKKEVEKKE